MSDCQIVRLCLPKIMFKIKENAENKPKNITVRTTGNILSDILYLHILYDCNSSMFASDQSYPLTFSREQRQFWFSAIKKKFSTASWLLLTADQNSTTQQFNSLGNTQIFFRLIIYS